MGGFNMGKYFEGNFSGDAFKLLSISHILALLTIVIVNYMIYIFREKIKNEKVDRIFRYTLAAVLIMQEISYNIWHAYIGDWSVGTTLPLHLCGISVVLSAVLLISKRYSLYEVVFFWGVGGATQALLTPDIGIYGFPHYRYFQFFISHGSIVTACLYATFVFGYRPRLKSIWRAIVALNIYMIFIAALNTITGGNYLFICQKPATASIMDFLGPWPWYIVSLEGLGIIIFFIVYIPFVIKDYLNRTKIKNNSVDM
jgi:hypothetical integral membrane protein (TIGR02206 family)